MLTFYRFIKEFHLEQEALALQYQANSLIKQVNNFIEGSPSDKIDKVTTTQVSAASRFCYQIARCPPKAPKSYPNAYFVKFYT
jgi:hypothetical protein